MSNSFLEGTGRGRRTAVFVVVVLSALALIAVAVALVVFAHRQAAPVSTAPRPNAPADVPVGPLTQIKGKRTVDGVSVGYPHTAAGAVSAAAEYIAQIGSTLDLERASAVMKQIADPSYTDAEADALQGRKSTRARLGIPETGAAPTGVAITIGPAAYQLRSVTDDHMTVLLLSYYTAVDVHGTIDPRVLVIPADVRWAGDDWKLLAPGASSKTDYSSLVAQPGTADAAAKGWQVITP